MEAGMLELGPKPETAPIQSNAQAYKWWSIRPPKLPVSAVRFDRFEIKDGLFFNVFFALKGSLLNTDSQVLAIVDLDDPYANRGKGKFVVKRDGNITAKVELSASSLKPFSQFVKAIDFFAPYLNTDAPFEADVDLALNSDVFAGQGVVDVNFINGAQIPVAGQIQHDLAARSGELTYQLDDVDLSSQNFDLKKFAPEASSVAVESGKLDAKGEMNWQWDKAASRWNFALGSIGGTLSDLAFSRDQYAVQGGELKFALASIAPLRTFSEHPVSLKIRKVSAGVDIEDIQLKLHADGSFGQKLPRVTLEKFSAGIFGATVKIKFAVFDPSKSMSAFVVRIKGLDLEKLLMKYPQENLHGTGVLDGVLPIVVDRSGKPSIPGGRLIARAPGGTLNYNSGMDQGGSGVMSQAQQVFNILEHFDYSDMKVDVSYGESGDMLLGVQLKGVSPRFQEGREVNLNVNVEENLPALLKSVLVTKGVGQQVSDRIVDSLSPSKK
jgi:hypothetical protein